MNKGLEKVSGGYRQILSHCAKCGTCMDNCPVDAISMVGDNYVIDKEKCVDCGTCEAVCPANAIEEISF